MTNIEFLNSSKKNIVFIVLQKKQGEQLLFNVRGTGILLKNKKVISCAHVYNEIPDIEKSNVFCGIMEPPKTDSKINSFKTSYKLKLASYDSENDLIVFDLIDSEEALADYGFDQSVLSERQTLDEIKNGDDVYFSGFSLANELIGLGMGITLTTDKCVISSVKYKNADGSIHFLLVDKQINPGGSGSPVFYNSKIIGLASGTLNRTHNVSGTLVQVPVGLGIVRPSNYILKLLQIKTDK